MNVFSDDTRGDSKQFGKLLRTTKGQLSEGDPLPLEELLFQYHDIFSLEDKWDEIDVVVTKEYHMPLIVKLLNSYKDWWLNHLANSSWSILVMSVRERDGTLCFCTEYSETKPDVFTLPRINDLLDQPGKSKYYSYVYTLLWILCQDPGWSE